MDNERDYNENSELHVDDGKQYETSELEPGNRPSRVTLDKKETVDGGANGHLSRHEKEPEVVESVHKYANRIKSFLGWEPNEEEQENEKESGKSTSEDAEGNNVTADECGPLGDFVNKGIDCESLEEKEKDKILAELRESEQITDVKPVPILKTDHSSDCRLIDSSPKSEVSETPNEDMNPEGDANSSPSSLKNNAVNNGSQLSSDTVSPQNESESVSNLNDSTPPEMKQNEHPYLNDSASLGNVPEDLTAEILGKENEASGNDLEKLGISDETENDQRTTCDLEMNDSKEKEVLVKNHLNANTESTISSTNVDKTEAKEDGLHGENPSETFEADKITDNLENAPHISDIKKPYMDEIRRLSIDIVKEVIESARNSVHEMFADKSEQQKIIENDISNHEESDTTYVGNGSRNLEAGNAEDKQNTTNQSIEEKPFLTKMYNELAESKDNMKATKDFQDYNKSTLDEETICGFGSYHPRWIQKYATPKVYLLFFSIVGIINGTYYTYVVSIISTLEKRYAFKTKVSGTLLLADEITPLVLGIIVGYLGSRTHRPRMVTLGMLSSAVCCFVSGLPYLMYGSAKHLTFQTSGNVTGPEVCFTEGRGASCDSDDRPPTMTVVGIFLFASFLKGFATLSYYVIGISYLDDNIKKKNTPMYLAVALALRLLGPLVGFLMSSAFLKIYEDPFDDPGFGPDDPRWIGAWWMGFFLQGVFLVIFTLPIALFPRRLPGQKQVEKLSSVTDKQSVRETLRDLVASLKRLGKNPVFVIMIINTTMKIFGHIGHSIMLPKYMENQFRLSAADASLFSGATSIFCVMVSTVLGGFLIWKFRPRIKLLLAGMVTSEIILGLGFLILMIPRCQPADMMHFGMNDDGLILDSVCNQNCDCSTTSFTPFCGPDGKTTYFSPCYAGCTQEIFTDIAPKKQVFGNCSCVSVTNSPDPSPATIIEGLCPDDSCWSKALAYLIILFIMLTISNSLTVVHTMLLLRSVHPGDKSIALGTFETFICLFGFIPFPVTFGALVDSACLVWEESCGETGNCWFYDMEKYSYLLHGAAAIFCSLSTICLITLYFLSSRVRDLYVEEEDEDEHIDNIKLDTVSGSVTKL